MYIPKYFAAYEVLPESYYFKFKLANQWYFFDDRILKLADIVREKFYPEFGSAIINNWYWADDDYAFQYSGYRPFLCKYGATLSPHKFGRGLDIKFEKIMQYSSPNEAQEAYCDIRKYIRQHPDEFPGLRGLELNVRWLHIDTHNRHGEGIQTFHG